MKKQLKGIKIAYDDDGSGNVLLFVHGHPFNRSMWSPQVAFFSKRYRIITPDLRGYGESMVSIGTVGLDEMAQDIANLLDELKISSAVLCGLSMGGQIVFEFYRLFPKRVKALVLADTFAQLDTEPIRKQRLENADHLVKEGMHKYAAKVLPKMIAPSTFGEKAKVADHVLRMMEGTNPEGAAAALRGRAARQDYTSLLSEIKVPTLIIVGSEDEFTPVSDAEFMHAKISDSKMAIIDGVGHMPNLESPDEFNRILAEFLVQAI